MKQRKNKAIYGVAQSRTRLKRLSSSRNKVVMAVDSDRGQGLSLLRRTGVVSGKQVGFVWGWRPVLEPARKHLIWLLTGTAEFRHRPLARARGTAQRLRLRTRDRTPEGGGSRGRMGNAPLYLSTRVVQWVSSPASSTASAWGDRVPGRSPRLL